MKEYAALLMGEQFFSGEYGWLVLKLLEGLLFMIGWWVPAFGVFVGAGLRLEEWELQFFALVDESCLFSDDLYVSAGDDTFDNDFSGA